MPGTDRRNAAGLMIALLTACVAFQLNASMLSPALVTMGEELNADQASIGLSQTWFFTTAALFSSSCRASAMWWGASGCWWA